MTKTTYVSVPTDALPEVLSTVAYKYQELCDKLEEKQKVISRLEDKIAELTGKLAEADKMIGALRASVVAGGDDDEF